jgi:hypothetical protein
MAKTTYPIPFNAETGSLVEWINPSLFSGKFPMPDRWYDTEEKCYVSEPTKPFPPYRTSLTGEASWKQKMENYDQELQKYIAEKAVFDARVNEGRYVRKPVYILKDNFVFCDTLSFIGYSRGRSSAKIDWISASTGAEYGMFLTDFEELVKKVGFNALDGRGVEAEFTFCKRGQNYGIKLNR